MMKRDMDLIREILLKTQAMPFWRAKSTELPIEETPTWRENSTGPNIRHLEEYRDDEGFLKLNEYLGIRDHSTEKISYHVKILAETNLIERVQRPVNPKRAEYSSTQIHIPTELTWWGHEFLEAIIDENRWNKVKNIMAATGGFVFEIAQSVAIKLLTQQVSSLLT